MANEWFYIQNGQQTGPVTFEQLQGMAQQGQVGHADLVWTDGMAEWQAAGAVQGLMPAQAPSGPVAPVPGPGGHRAGGRPGQYGGGYAARQRHRGPTGTPGMVIAGFILSFFCSLLGLIFCLVGLPEAKRRGAGVGLAIAGIIISIVGMVLGIVIQIAANS